ncbi:MAG TPA: glycine cleavage T C-terminal barrel domain-containing protein [Myxococcota bacterium]|nr:glycine cleavage T C-terminal barrel domain-containing protein [Myxococcota bacterium]
MTWTPDDREQVLRAARRDAVLFDMAHRGLLEVGGSDRTRWLDGMISNDVPALERRSSGAGCEALLLTNRGAIVADLHVGRLDEVYLLEGEREELPRIHATLERFVIADDVTIRDRSAEQAALGLEGPLAPAVLEGLLAGRAAIPAEDDWLATEIEGVPLLVAAFGWSGEGAYQLRVPADRRAQLEGWLDQSARRVVGGGARLLRGDLAALEVLRVEVGIPRLGAELDEDVLPPEARLDRAIATRKGCYVGQEIVARLRSRGQVNHLLVGLRLEPGPGAAAPIPSETPVFVDGRRTGELTSVVDSPRAGAIALGFVRREHAEPGTRVELEGGLGAAIVSELPFVPPASPTPRPEAPAAGPA